MEMVGCSGTQGAVAKSSGEAEYHAAVKGASEGLSFQSACRDLGIHFQQPDRVCVLTDSSVRRNLPKNRIGEGKTSGGCLLVADLTREGRTTVTSIPGQLDPAALMTNAGRAHQHCWWLVAAMLFCLAALHAWRASRGV